MIYPTLQRRPSVTLNADSVTVPSPLTSPYLRPMPPVIKVNVELKSAQPEADGLCRVRIVMVRGTRARHYFGINVKPSDWDGRRRRIKNSDRHSAIKNDRIEQEVQRAEGIAIADPSLSPSDIVERLKVPVGSGSITLADAIEADIAQHGHRLTYGTKKGRVTVVRDVRQALPLATIQGLSVSQVSTLDRWYVDKGISVNTRRSRLRRLRTMYCSACRTAGIDQRDIFRGLIPAEVDTGAKFLQPAEVDALRVVSLPTAHLQLARDAFLLSYLLGGVRFGDLCRLQNDMLQDGALVWTAGKVPRPRWAPVNPEAAAILHRYAGGVFLLPLLKVKSAGVRLAMDIEAANASINRALQDVSRLAGIRPITMHMARHTWAQAAKSATGDVHAVSKILGHARVATTERYLSRFDREAVAGVFEKMNKKEHL